MGFNSEPVENTGELYSNITGAIDHDTLRPFRKVQRLVRSDGMVGKTGHVRNLRPAACRHQNPFSGQFAVANTDAVRPGDDAAPLDQFDTGIRQQRPVNPLQPVEFSILRGDERRPVMTIDTHPPAIAGGIGRIGGKGRAIHQQFLRNTAADDAGAAGAAFLDYRHARAMAGGNPRCTDAAGTGADHNQVELKCHGSGLSGWWTRP